MAKRKVKVTEDNWLSVNPFKLDALTVEQLRRRAAKQANQRLVRLEGRKGSTGETLAEVSSIAQYAYQQIRDIKSKADAPGKGKKLRFREQRLPIGESQARMELYVLQSFLSERTSKAGTAARYVSKTERKFLEKGITVASYKSFYNFLNSATFTDLIEKGLNSEDIVELYNAAHEGENGEKGKSFAAIDKIITDYIVAMEREGSGEIDQRGLAKALGVKPLR